MVQIEFFTPEQKSSIPSYREKWREIALSTEPLDQQRAAAAIKSAYAAIGKRQPILEFCSSPQDALSKIVSSIPNAEHSQEISLREMSWQKWLVWVAKWTFTSGRMRSRQQNQPLNQLNKQLLRSPDEFLKQKITNLIPSESSSEEIVETIYQAVRDARELAAEEQLSGFPDRSSWSPKAVLDMLINGYLLHSDTEAAIQFVDGFSIWVDHGVASEA